MPPDPPTRLGRHFASSPCSYLTFWKMCQVHVWGFNALFSIFCNPTAKMFLFVTHQGPWKNIFGHGKVLEFCHRKSVGTLIVATDPFSPEPIMSGATGRASDSRFYDISDPKFESHQENKKHLWGFRSKTCCAGSLLVCAYNPQCVYARIGMIA